MSSLSSAIVQMQAPQQGHAQHAAGAEYGQASLRPPVQRLEPDAPRVWLQEAIGTPRRAPKAIAVTRCGAALGGSKAWPFRSLTRASISGNVSATSFPDHGRPLTHGGHCLVDNRLGCAERHTAAAAARAHARHRNQHNRNCSYSGECEINSRRIMA